MGQLLPMRLNDQINVSTAAAFIKFSLAVSTEHTPCSGI